MHRFMDRGRTGIPQQHARLACAWTRWKMARRNGTTEIAPATGGALSAWIQACALASVVTVILSVGPSAAAPASADPGKLISTLAQGIPHSAFFGLRFDGRRGVAVGAAGAIAESADSGASWQPVPHSLTELALLAVDVRDGRALAVGQFGLVMASDAPGKWRRIQTDFQTRLYSVALAPSGTAIAVGEFGAVLKSTDGGETWSSAAPDWSAFADPEAFGTGEPSIFSVRATENGEFTIAGEFGVMLRSSDEGESWQVLLPVRAKAPTLFSMHLVPEGRGTSFAVGQAGTLLSSSNGGRSWLDCGSKTDSNFLGVTASSSGQVVVTGMRVMMRSVDGGLIWDPVREGDTFTDWYQSVHTAPDTGQIMAVGHSGRIIRIGG